jgi:amino acid adenylation domain-containing protein
VDAQPFYGVLISLVAQVLGCDASDVASRAGDASFAMLGGTSLQAIELAAVAPPRCGRALDVMALLEPRPLAEVLTAARPAGMLPGPAPARPGESSELSRAQSAMLFGERLYRDSAFHLLFSADIRGQIETPRLRSALAALTRRHSCLRTVFTSDDEQGGLGRRVLDRWQPVLIEQTLPVLAGADLVATVHAMLAPASACMLEPFERPPVAFVLTRADAQRAVLSIVVHHAVVDGWSIGLLWRELAAEYVAPVAPPARSGDAGAAAPSMDAVIGMEGTAEVKQALRQRVAVLAGLPGTVEIPSDLQGARRLNRAGTRLVFGLSEQARIGCASLTGALGLTRNTVLLAAWALVIARRTAMSEFVMGMASACRTTADSLRLVGPCGNMLPVVCQITDGGSVGEYLRETAAQMRAALDATWVPFEEVVAALGLGGDDARSPLVQVAFASHDELVPDVLHAGNLTLRIHEGHCGATVFDAVLYVQRWGESPRLALEYATSALRPDEAAELAQAVDRVVVEMAAAPQGPLADVRTMTAAQRRWLEALADGPDAATGTGLWPLVEEAAGRNPDGIAVRDADPARTLTYRQLLRAAGAQSAELAAAGVAADDCVALAVGRSAREIVAILAVLRLGAAYLGIDPGIPAADVSAMLDAAQAGVVLGDEGLAAPLGIALVGRTWLPIIDPWDPAAGDGPLPVPAEADPSRIAYVAFTSGSTGIPKGTRVPDRGVVRLTLNPAYLRPGAAERFARLAPLAFDASTLEIFTPLLAGGTVEVVPGPYPTPDSLAEFLRDREITGLWLTSGLFRLVADHRPDAFAGLRQLLTGGDVVPPGQAARVLRVCPGLRLSNGYGPTENTTFTTVHHVDDPAEVTDPLPIGRPVPGTGVLVLDGAGRLVPPGGIGELYTYGAGLALGYVGPPDETARAFGRFSPETDRTLYRTGDLARWDGTGRLRFLGRRDRQVKIRGFRIELDAVARVLREHPAVTDAAVMPTATADRRLVAGVVATGDAKLLDSVRRLAAERLPGYAVPSLWAVVSELPLTVNGKVDAARLQELATVGASEAAAAPSIHGDIEQAIADTWQQVLGTSGFGTSDTFFDAGGDSLQLLRVAASLRRKMPHHEVTIQELYAHRTIGALADHLRARSAGA